MPLDHQFFSPKGSILVEGDAEQMVIPALIKAVFGVTPDELGFSLISMDSAFFENIATVFHQDRIERPCAILTDSDQAIINLPEDFNEDTEEERDARNSQNSGVARKEALDAFCQDNIWTEPFYAEHTFEVDFVGVGNKAVAIAALNSIYNRQSTKNKSATKLRSQDKAVYGTEVLRLAKKKGKGWFALLLSEHVNTETSIPNYIIEALAYILESSISTATLKKIAEYRIKKFDEQDETREAIEELGDCSQREYFDAYIGHAPSEDDLVLLWNAISEFSA